MSKDKDIKPYQIYLDNEHTKPASPVTKAEYVTMEGGQNVEDFLSNDIKNGIAEGVTNDLKLDSASFNGPVDITIKGNTIQNILPNPSSEFITHSKPEFDLEDGPLYPTGFEPVAVDGKLEDLQIQGQTLKNLAFKTSPAEYESSGESDTFKTNLTGLDKDKYGLQDEYDHAVIKGQTVVNHLAKTCGTPAKTHTNERDIIPGVNSPLAIETCDGFFHEAKLYGKTLKNELVPHGTEVNTIKHTERYNDGLGIELQDNVEYDMAVLQGKTLVNYIQDDTSADDYVAFDNDYNGTNITINDTIDGNIQRAVLEGKTLVNINRAVTLDENCVVDINNYQTIVTWTDSYNTWEVKNIKLFKPSTKYYIKTEVVENTLTKNWSSMIGHASSVTSENNSFSNYIYNPGETGIKVSVFTTKDNFSGCTCGLRSATERGCNIGEKIKYRVSIIEYEEGMENWDIPYFEGMQSVTVSTRLENLCHRGTAYDTKTGATFTSGKYETRIACVFTTSEVAQNFKPATRYMVQFKVSNLVLDGLNEIVLTMSEGTIESGNSIFGNSGSQQLQISKNGIYRRVVTTSEVYSTSNFSIKGWAEQWENSNPISSTRTLTISDIMCIEYQDGMENWDLEYFDDYQIVNPVQVKNINKNLFDINKATENSALIWSNGKTGIEQGSYVSDFIKVEKGKTYYLSGTSIRTSNTQVFGYDKNKNYIRSFNGQGIESAAGTAGGLNVNFFTVVDSYYIRFSTRNINGIVPTPDIIQLEELSTSTSYVAHQSKTISATEPVTLRAIGDIKDTLDLRTGEYVQRIGEIVLNGSENWLSSTANTDEGYLCYEIDMDDYIYWFSGINQSKILLSDSMSLTSFTSSSTEGLFFDGWGLYVRLKATSRDEFIKKLSDRPVKVQYARINPIVSYIPLDSPILKTYDGERSHLNTVCLDGTLVPDIHVSKEVSYNAIMAPSQEYTLYMTRTNNPDTSMYVNIGGNDIEVLSTDKYYKSVATPSTITNSTVSYYGHKHKLKEVMLISPKAEGEHLDYFMGMQSVVNPVIETKGKKIIDIPDFTGTLREIPNRPELGTIDRIIYKNIPLDPKLTYSISLYTESYNYRKCCVILHNTRLNESYYEHTQAYVHKGIDGRELILGYGNTFSGFNYATITTGGSFTLAEIPNVSIGDTVSISNIQLEISDTPTEYEQEYKSNTTTIPIQLNSLPNGVCDELDLNTGLYIKRVGEITLDGVNNTVNVMDNNNDTTYLMYIHKNDMLQAVSDKPEKAIICNRFNEIDHGFWDNSDEGISTKNGYKTIYMNIYRSLLDSVSYNGCNRYLANNPVTIQYQLETPVVLTPDDADYPEELKSLVKPKQYSTSSIFLSSDELKPNLKYSLKTTNYYDIQGINNSDTYTTYNITGSFLDQTNLTTNYTGLLNRSTTKRVVVNGVNPMVVKGQKINDLPYFTGLANFKTKAIKLSDGSTGYSVVKNTGKNLARNFGQANNKTSASVISDNYIINNDVVTVNREEYLNNNDIWYTANYYWHTSIGNAQLIPVKPNAIYTVSYSIKSGSFEWRHISTGESGTDTSILDPCFAILNAKGNVIKFGGNTEQIPPDGRYISWLRLHHHTDYESKFTDFSFTMQLEEGSTATTYEPYFENTVYVDEELQLRSLPDGTCDELDLNTGILTRRVGEKILDCDVKGNNWWKYGTEEADTAIGAGTSVFLKGHSNLNWSNVKNKIICDKLIYNTDSTYEHEDWYGNTFAITYKEDIDANSIYVNVPKSIIPYSFNSKYGVTTWIYKNKPIIQYELATPIREKIELKTRGNYKKKQITGITNLYNPGKSKYMYRAYNSSSCVDMYQPAGSTTRCKNVFFTDKYRISPESLYQGYMPDHEYENIARYLNGIYISINKNKLNAETIEAFNSYLNTNPFNIWYRSSSSISETTINRPIHLYRGHLIQASNVACDVKYSLPTRNYYHLRDLKPNTQYTLKYVSDYTINNTYVANRPNSIITSESISNYYALVNSDLYLPSMYEGTHDVKYTTNYIESSCYNIGDSVIKNTGKNLFNINCIPNTGAITRTDTGFILSGYSCSTTRIAKNIFPNLRTGKRYTLTYDIDNNNASTAQNSIGFYRGSDKLLYFYRNGDTFEYTEEKAEMSVILYGVSNTYVTYSNIQIEEGSTATEYEPYRENIITPQLADKLQLRSLPDGTCDTFNAKTGIITRWVGKEVLNENSPIGIRKLPGAVEDNRTAESICMTYISQLITGEWFSDSNINRTGNSTIIENFREQSYHAYYATEPNLFGLSGDGVLYITLDPELFTDITLDSIKAYLKDNPITIYAKLKTPTYETITMTNSNPDNDVFANGHTTLTNNGVSPKLMYGLKTTNYYYLPTLADGKYTVNTEGNYIINNETKLAHGQSNIELANVTDKTLFCNQPITIVEGDLEYLPMVDDVSTVTNASVTFTDADGNNATTIDLSRYALNSLPNGVHDAIDIKNGYYIQRVGVVTIDGNSSYGWYQNYTSTGNWTMSIQYKSLNSKINIIDSTEVYASNFNSIFEINPVNNNLIMYHTLKNQSVINYTNDESADILFVTKPYYHKIPLITGFITEGIPQYFVDNPVTVYYELQDYILTPIEELQLPNVYKGGKVQVTADSVLPKVKYKYPTNNSYVVDKLLPNTTYTLRTNSANDFYIGGTLYDRSSGDKYEFNTSSNLSNRFMIFKGSVQADACNPCLLVGSSNMYPLIPKKIDNLTIHAPYLDSDKCLIRTTSKNLFDISRMKEREWDGKVVQNPDETAMVILGENYVITTHDNNDSGGLGYELYLEPNKQYIVHLDFEGDSEVYIKGFFNISAKTGVDWYSQRITCYENKHYTGIIESFTGCLQLTCNKVGGTYAKFSNIAIYEYNDDTTEVYEPFHSHVTELYDENGNDIELLSIPGTDIRDELIIDNDYRTARLIKRVGKIQLTSSLSWGNDQRYIYYNLKSSEKNYKPNGNIVDDLFSHAGKYDIDCIRVNCGQSQFIQLMYDSMKMRSDIRTGTDARLIILHILDKYKPTIYYELDLPQITELQMTSHPVAHTNGHILLETKNPALIEATYPINQTAQIDNVNSMIAEHDIFIDDIYELMDIYVDSLITLLTDKAVLEYAYDITDEEIQQTIEDLESDIY